MSKKLLAIYEEALEAIRDMNPITPEVREIAVNALAEGEKANEVDKATLLIRLRDFIMANGMIFDTAEEMCEKLNADGTILTLRNKPWSKASIARLMPEIRAAILAATALVPVAGQTVTFIEPEDEPLVGREGEVVEEAEVAEPAPEPVASPIEAQIADELDELDELAELLENA